MRRLLVWMLGVCLLAPCAIAFAHLGSTKYLRATPRSGEGGELVVDVHASVEVVDAAIGVGLPEDAPVSEVLARSDTVRRWLAEGISVRRGDAPCDAVAEPPTRETHDERAYLGVELRYRCGGSGPLQLSDDTVFPTDRQHEALLYIGEGESSATVLRFGSREYGLDAPDPGLGQLAKTFLFEGAVHFATGYDHVLFLLSLILGAGWVARRRGTRAALRDLAWLVTAFTLGHSVTLALAALEVVTLPSQPVEIVIAGSIVFVALYNVLRPEARSALPWVAGVFGLVHGFGFSSVLAGVGLPASGTLVALLSFNVGIELAQLAFVAIVIVPLVWLGRREHYAVFVRVASGAIAALALYWTVTRTLG